MRFVVVTLLCLGAYLLSPVTGYGKGGDALSTISFQSESKDSEIIEIGYSGKTVPKIFKLDGDKPRLVLDFADTTYRGKTQFPAIGGELVRGIRVGFHKKPEIKTRVVVDLVRGRDIYWQEDLRPEEKLLVLSIKGGGTTSERPLSVVLPPAKSKTRPKQNIEVASNPVPDKEGEPKVVEQATPPQQPKPVLAGNDQQMRKEPSSHDGPVLLDVSFDNVYAKSGEMVLFKLNDFHPPSVSAIEKGQPRIVCDFLNARMVKKIPSEIDAEGKLIEKIRLARHSEPDKIRVVLDLRPGNDYDLQQVFFKEDNLFVLIINTLAQNGSSSQ